MLFVFGANAIYHLIALQKIFLTKHRVGLLVSRIGAHQFTNKTLATVFVETALRRVHLQQSATLIVLGLFGLCQACY